MRQIIGLLLFAAICHPGAAAQTTSGSASNDVETTRPPSKLRPTEDGRLDDHLQTLAGVVYSSVNLDFHGIGDNSLLGDGPFYLRPFLYLRGATIMRYQGEETPQIETEFRWQFWKRFSLVGFVGGGAAWNDFERLDDTQTVVTGGAGFRYEIARRHGIHMGLDVAFGPDNTALYVQVGSTWARP